MSFKTSVFLRRAEREDLDAIVGWMEDVDFMRFLYGDPARSPKRIREHIVTMLGRTAGNTMPAGVYLLVDSKEYGPVGLLSVQNISWRNRSCHVDTYIGLKKLRAGVVAGIAFYRALEYAFYELNMHRVNLFVYSFNTSSWRIIERTGAPRELTLKEHVLRDGKLYDMYCYGLLRCEFDVLHNDIGRRFPDYTLKGNQEAYENSLENAESST